MSIQRIHSVTSVDLHIHKTNPPKLHVTAAGEASSASHRSPRLERRIYIVFPQDGIQEYDFVVDVPDEPGADVMTPLKAEDTWENFPPQLNGVRVYAQTNKLEKMV